jgi:hypothetical protein
VRHLLLLPAFLLTLNALPGPAAGQTVATTTVTVNPGTVTAGSAVELTATVQPSAAPGGGKTIPKPTGTITFLDGTTPLSSAPIALAPNGLASAAFAQTFGTPDPTFTTQSTITYSGEVVGDLNGDGVPDLLIYNFGNPFSVQTFTSNGKGGYNTSAVQTLGFTGCSASGYDVVGSPQLIDLNGDGKTDLLCGILVAYGNGDGIFAQAVPVPFLSSGFYTAYAADLNGDGKTDLLAVPTISQTDLGSPIQFAFTVFLNQGGGSFASAGTFPVAPISYLSGTGFFPPIVVDLNNDGKPDIISQTLTFGDTQEDNPQRSVDVLLNNGDGTFGMYMPVTLSTPPNNDGGPAPYVMGYGDVNGDGKPDLILTLTDTAASVDAMVLLGNGDGTFQPQINLILNAELGVSANQAPSISVEDLSLDGKQDLIFGNGQVELGNGDGTFVLSTPLFAYPQSSTPPWAFPLVQMTLPGNLVPSLVYLLPTATPPAVSVFTPQTSSSSALSLTTLAVGTHTITAQYSGDANYGGDTSAPVTVTVTQAVSTTAVTSSANPSLAGQSVTLTAKVTSNGPTPTGNVTFTSGSTTLATVALSGGSAAYTTTSFTKAGTLVITASYSGDANTQASSATLSLVVNGPTLTLSPSSITFPGQYVGTSGLPITVTATNPGSAPLTITSVTTSSNNFGVLNACGGSLAAGSSCAIGVFFDPSSSGAVSGTLTIADNASGSPQTIALSGSGQDFSFTSSSSTQTVTPGSTATYMIAVNPIAGFNQMVSLSCSGAPTGSTCSLSPNSIALSGSTPASVTVSVTTVGNSAAATQPRSPNGAQIPIFFAICGLPGLLLLGGRRSALWRGKNAAIYGAALLGIVCFVMAGCGGNSSSTGGGSTPANTYTLTVTGTFASGSATLTHSTNLTMVVQ